MAGLGWLFVVQLKISERFEIGCMDEWFVAELEEESVLFFSVALKRSRSEAEKTLYVDQPCYMIYTL